MQKIFIIFSLFCLAACGFHPLYAKKKSMQVDFDGNKTVNYTSYADEQLALTFVEPVSNKMGQLLRSNIRDMINPKGTPSEAKYSLTVEVNMVNETEQGIQSDNIATRKTRFFEAKYTLKDETKKEIISGNAKTEASYNLLSSPYASVIALEDAEKDAAAALANDIGLRLRVYFSTIEAKPKKNGNLF